MPWPEDATSHLYALGRRSSLNSPRGEGRLDATSEESKPPQQTRSFVPSIIVASCLQRRAQQHVKPAATQTQSTMTRRPPSHKPFRCHPKRSEHRAGEGLVVHPMAAGGTPQGRCGEESTIAREEPMPRKGTLRPQVPCGVTAAGRGPGRVAVQGGIGTVHMAI